MDLLLEIGTEELPASFQGPAVEWMARELALALVEARLHPALSAVKHLLTGATFSAGEINQALKTYATPRAMTMREVAKEAFGDELYWNRVWDLNLNLSTDAVLPQGTRIALPLDAKVGQ